MHQLAGNDIFVENLCTPVSGKGFELNPADTQRWGERKSGSLGTTVWELILDIQPHMGGSIHTLIHTIEHRMYLRYELTPVLGFWSFLKSFCDGKIQLAVKVEIL